tara:strand:+ start:164 stop:2041 length:1878 start_codon:yes stop_codon:yes gene_type:complete
MAEEKDPLKITLREASQLYNKEIGTSKITSFNAKSKYGKYGDIALVDAFKGNKGSRVIDKILGQTDTPGTFNTMIDNLRLISQPVRRRIALANPNDPSLNTLPGLEAKDEQTKIVFGERKASGQVAKIAILTDNRQGWKEFFDQIDKIANDPKNPKQAIANAFRVSYFTGPRPGLIAGLQGSEYLVDQGAIYVTPQTKVVGVAVDEQETRKGASKGETSFKKGATPYTVPLGENAHAYLQQQLKINANDPDIKSYLEEQSKKGKTPIFVQKIVDKKGNVKISTINTSAISDMLSGIKTSTPIIIDNQSGKEYNTLNPVEKTKTGKFGSPLARNIHASIALNELNEDDKLIDFLHGRSETSGTKGRGQTKKMDYALRPRGRFTQGERDGQQRITNWINGVQGKDVTAIPDVQNNVTKANYAIKGFFDAPLTDQEIADTTGIKDNLFKKLADGEISLDLSKIRNNLKGKGKYAVGTFITGTALSAVPEDAFSAVAEFGTQLALEEILDAGAIKILQGIGTGASATPIGLGLTAATTTVSPAGEGSAFEKENQYANMLGVSRNALLNLQQNMPEEYKKLENYIEKRITQETVLDPDAEQAKGEAFRSMGSADNDPTNLFVQEMLALEN